VCTSTDAFKEYIEVLSREKFRKYPEFVAKAEIVLNKLYELSIKYIPSTKLSVIPDDPDNRILELAVTAQADYIVTGNTRDFTFDQYEGVKIVSPEQFVSIIEA
jgi:putative PIN family toxin of toxin-antitoxin system